MIILPAIDIRGGKCVRLMQGDYSQETVYGESPVAMAQHWVSLGAQFLHLVDLDGARAGSPVNGELIAEIAKTVDVPVEVGGGIRDEAAIEYYLSRGVARVILGTRALEDPVWLQKECDKHAGRIVCGIDARDSKIAVRGWEQESDVVAVDFIERLLNPLRGLRAIIFTDIATDGTLAGPNIDATRAVCERTHIPVIASGGIGTIQHVRAVATLPVEGLIIGRALYAGTVTLEEALKIE
jgi:phosphoribosylformimino-5-aminoimidazole carboxamide ribotide isomerase